MKIRPRAATFLHSTSGVAKTAFAIIRPSIAISASCLLEGLHLAVQPFHYLPHEECNSLSYTEEAICYLTFHYKRCSPGPQLDQALSWRSAQSYRTRCRHPSQT